MSDNTPWQVFRQALQDERARTATRLRSQEPHYLPAALEVVENPVSPTGRVTAWVLLIGVLTTLGWLVFGHVDIVASARGRMMPTDDVKLVQAANTGIVRRIHVHDGDTVRRGQPLIDLDPTVSTAEESQAQKAMLAAAVDVARGEAIADGLAGRPIRFVAPEGTPPDIAETQRQLVAAQVAAAGFETAGMEAARRSALSDAQGSAAQADALRRNVPVLDRELDAMKELDAHGFAPGLKMLELQRERSGEVGSRDAAVAQRARALADAAKFGEQAAQSRQQAQRTALADLAAAQSQLLLRREELIKARQRSRMQRLFAPADGTVQQLAVHTVGGVVEAARPLMVVVPNDRLMFEAHILNRDAGFVRVGQRVDIKLESFPFTRYGAVAGRIVTLGRDAVQDKSGSYYTARIAVDSRSIMVDGQRAPLVSGMTATADIRIGSRRLLSYLISPLDAGLAEAARER